MFEHTNKKISSKHLEYMTDDFGIWQHSVGNRIDRQHGYALDDSARAIVFSSMIKNDNLTKVYLEYLKKSISENIVINFFDQNRKPLGLPWSEDALGEAAWGLSTCLEELKFSTESLKLLSVVDKKIMNFDKIRGISYALIATSVYNKQLAKTLANKIIAAYNQNSRINWHWPENFLSYANAIIPLSLITYGQRCQNTEAADIGLAQLDFLNNVCKKNNIPIMIGNSGWFFKGKKKSLFDQQPIDCAYLVLANIFAHEITGNKKYLNKALFFYSWFWGNNIIRKSLVDTNTAMCHDGIWQSQLSPNSGAESIVCYLIVQEKINAYLK